MTDAAVRIALPPLVAYQHDALFNDRRLAVIEGSPKCGKTYPCLIWLVHEMIARGAPGRAFWWVAPIYSQADIAYGRLVALLAQADPDKKLWSTNAQKKTVSLANGATAHFKTAENADSLFGEDVYAAVIDEATRVRADAWTAVRSTTTATGGRIRVIGNVKGRKNWAYRLARRAEAGEKGMHYARMTADMAVDAGLFPRSELENARSQLPESVFRELYYCEPTDDGANPFGMHHIAACSALMSGAPAVAYGVDLAKSIDYTVVVGLDEDAAVCYFDRWQGLTWDLTESKLADAVGYAPCYMDSSGVGDPIVERVARSCPNVKPYPTGARKQGLIESLAVDIQARRVHYPDGIIRAELESFEYKLSPSLKVQYSAPDGQHDDCVVALALANAMYRERNMYRPEVAYTHARARAAAPTKDWYSERRNDPDWGFA